MQISTKLQSVCFVQSLKQKMISKRFWKRWLSPCCCCGSPTDLLQYEEQWGREGKRSCLQPAIVSRNEPSSSIDVDMLKHVDDLSMTDKLAGCWFHQWKGDSITCRLSQKLIPGFGSCNSKWPSTKVCDSWTDDEVTTSDRLQSLSADDWCHWLTQIGEVCQCKSMWNNEK